MPHLCVTINIQYLLAGAWKGSCATPTAGVYCITDSRLLSLVTGIGTTEISHYHLYTFITGLVITALTSTSAHHLHKFITHLHLQ